MGETPSLTGKFVGEAHRILEHTQTDPSGNQHLKGHNPLVGSEGSDVKQDEGRASLIVPSQTLPDRQHHNTAMWVALP